MNDKQIENFKYLLKNYKFYSNEIDKITQQIEDIQYQLNGVKGIDYSKIRGTGEKSFNHGLAEEKDFLKKKKEAFEILIKIVDTVFNQISEETKSYLIEIYVEGNAYDNVADKHNYSKHGIYYKIHSELKKVEYY